MSSEELAAAEGEPPNRRSYTRMHNGNLTKNQRKRFHAIVGRLLRMGYQVKEISEMAGYSTPSHATEAMKRMEDTGYEMGGSLEAYENLLRAAYAKGYKVAIDGELERAVAPMAEPSTNPVAAAKAPDIPPPPQGAIPSERDMLELMVEFGKRAYDFRRAVERIPRIFRSAELNRMVEMASAVEGTVFELITGQDAGA